MPKTIFPPFNEKYVRSTNGSADRKCFLHIYGAGIVYPDTRYEFSKLRDSYIFEYVVSGQGFIESEKGYAAVSAGDCIVAAKGKHIHYGSDKKNPYVKMWFSVTGDFIKPIFDVCMPTDTDFVVKRVNVYSLFEKMLAYLEGNDEDDPSVLSGIILDILFAVTGRISASDENDESRGTQIKQYIDNFFIDGADIKRAAEHLGITEKVAKKAFTDRYGITPSKYIREKKLERSRELLEHSEKSVSEIAHSLHFCDQSYFSTAFKNRYGLYPSEYRDKVIAERRKIN